MDIKFAARLQKKGIITHRLVFIFFILQRITLQVVNRRMPLKNTIILSVFVLISALLEELLLKFSCFKSLTVLRIIRFVQCSITAIMLVFTESATDSSTLVLGLLTLFVVDLFITFDISDRITVFGCAAGVGAVVLIALFIRMALINDNKWMYMFFGAMLIGIILVSLACLFSEYIRFKDKQLLDERRKLENIVEKNENILNMQNKLRNTNDQLNIQKLDLQRANKQIKEANEEMKAQAEIMHYIASSFDVPKISDQITDAIMNVKKLNFCGVYINKGVYHNKKPAFVIKTKNEQIHEMIMEHIEQVYQHMVEANESEHFIHNNMSEHVKYLKQVNINSVYIRLLGDKNEKYGLFMIGDSRRDLFKDTMSFYNAIIAQFDIAISNAKIYNDMQHMARKDGLTGINNRIYFNELFTEHAKKIVEEKSCMSVALFDIDKFKNVNDTYGHLAGDEVIKRIATVTEECIDKYDGFVCRYGGEEFVAVLPEKNLEQSEPIIRELFELLCKQVVEYNEYRIELSVSVGLTAYPEVCDSTDELLKRADWCMYYSKEHGRRQLKVDDGTIDRE